MGKSLILARYLIHTLMNWFLVVALAVGSIIAIFDFTELFRRAALKTKIGFPILLKMLFLRFPIHMQEVLPFIVLFAAIMAFWRLNRNSEVVVMRASGISIWQILSPLVMLGLAIGAFDLVFLSPISAKLMSRFEVLENKYLSDRSEAISIADTGLWLREGLEKTDRLMHVLSIDFKKKLLHKITLYEFDKKDVLLKRSDADVAILGHNTLDLKDVWQVMPGSIAEKIDHVRFHTSLDLKTIQESTADPRTLPFWALIYYANLMEHSGLSGQKYILRWHGLLAGCIWLGVMVILAATFSLNPLRSRQASLMIGIGVIASFLLYFFRDMTTALGLAGTIPSILAAWAPTIVTAFFTITKLLYSEEG